MTAEDGFTVTVVDGSGVQTPLATLPDLEAALHDRDARRASRGNGGRELYLVHDAGDPEAGYAEWAECGVHGTFEGADAECEICNPYEPTEADAADLHEHAGWSKWSRPGAPPR